MKNTWQELGWLQSACHSEIMRIFISKKFLKVQYEIWLIRIYFEPLLLLLFPEFVLIWIFISRLAEIFEKEKEIYMRKDPDPFDERHPYRTDPSCQFGFLLKQLFRKDIFMKKVSLN